MLDVLTQAWPHLFAVLHATAAAAVTVDAVLRKRHVSAVIGWVGLAWLTPGIGSLLYLVFGINRIQRNTVALDLLAAWKNDKNSTSTSTSTSAIASDAQAMLQVDAGLAGLEQLCTRLTGKALLAGNHINVLEDGDAAYPAMLDAIEGARHSITLATYIFDNDAAGQAFLLALRRARERGVEVRVLLDGLGLRYSRPDMLHALQHAGLTAVAFSPTRNPLRSRYANLRNHRKIMVVDGTFGFTGGMNIRVGHWLGRLPAKPVRCLHFGVRGPVVADLQRTFAVDWAYACGEQLLGELWFPALDRCGPVAARGVADGPDADIDNLPQVLLGALAVARTSVRIVTPYFLPDETLLAALKVTALRGVAVEIVLPERSNLRVMDWATRPQLPELLASGCRIYLSPPPFDHTKLFLIDEHWSLIGSTNWDARSLRLNFEYNLVCIDASLAQALDRLVCARVGSARRVGTVDLEDSPVLVRLRNGVARLMSPYL
jgi:cardiolipin synthase